MKKIILSLLLLASPAFAAQQEITVVPDSPVLPSIGALKDAVNLRLADIDENFDEIYPVLAAGPVYVNPTAPSDTKVVWIDTDQDNAIKVRIGEVWTVVGTAGEAYPLPTAAADTLGGVKVGARLTITDGVLSADVQTGDGDDLGSAAYTDVVALWATCTGYLKSDGTCDTPSGSATYPSAAGVVNWDGSAWGTSYTVGTAANNLVQLNSSGELPFTIDVKDLADTTNLLGGGGYDDLTEFVNQTAWRLFYSDGSGDVQELALGASGTVLKSNGSSAAPSWQADSTAEGAGYVSTTPTYSDEACTNGQYALDASYRYDCLSNTWSRTARTGWDNPTPADGTPNAFTLTDVTDAALSTQYTALAQITGIDTGITCSGSGGTVAACTGSTEESCGAFGSTSGTITNNQYVGARVTSSGSNSTAVNNVVTCGGVSDTFTVTTVAASSYDDIIFWWRAESSTLGTGDYPTSGTTPTVDFDDGSGYTTGAMKVGTYGLDLKTWDKIDWPVTGVNATWRIGGWIRFKSIAADYVLMTINGTTEDYVLKIQNTNEIEFWGPWESLQTTTADVAIDTWYYIELVMDDTNNVAKIFIDGVEKASYSTAFAGYGALTNIRIGGDFGNVTYDLDNLAISNDVSRDLYALRNNTSSPR